MLIGFLTLSLNCFSQTDTTKVVLPTKTVRLVIKELMAYDGCKQELVLTLDKVIKLQEREGQKDTAISILKEKDTNNQFIITQKDSQIGQYKIMTDDLKREIKSQRAKTFLYKVGTFIGIITTSYLLIK